MQNILWMFTAGRPRFISVVNNHFVFETCVSRCKIRALPNRWAWHVEGLGKGGHLMDGENVNPHVASKVHLAQIPKKNVPNHHMGLKRHVLSSSRKRILHHHTGIRRGLSIEVIDPLIVLLSHKTLHWIYKT